MSHPILVRLASADPAERREACLQAAEDPAGTLLTEALGDALGDPSKAVARAASDALVQINQKAGGVDSVLRRALHSDAPQRRWSAAFTTARVEPPSPKLLPALVEALGSDDGDVRWAAARLLVRTGRLHGEVLMLLVGLVRAGEHAVVRRMASYALRELAPDRIEAATVLLEATEDIDLHVRRAALTAMASLWSPPAAVPRRLLRVVGGDPDAASRRLAALALGEIGARDARAVPPETHQALLDVAAEAELDVDLRRAVDRALLRLGAASEPRGGAAG